MQHLRIELRQLADGPNFVTLVALCIIGGILLIGLVLFLCMAYQDRYRRGPIRRRTVKRINFNSIHLLDVNAVKQTSNYRRDELAITDDMLRMNWEQNGRINSGRFPPTLEHSITQDDDDEDIYVSGYTTGDIYITGTTCDFLNTSLRSGISTYSLDESN